MLGAGWGGCQGPQSQPAPLALTGAAAPGPPVAAPQHSTTLTASPPRAVSLYLSFMSAPVCRIVLMTLSRETTWLPSPCRASRAALIALTEAIALRSMQGI